jgi:hypothetical protein
MDEMGHIETGNIGPHQSISEWNESNRRKEMEFGHFYMAFDFDPWPVNLYNII